MKQFAKAINLGFSMVACIGLGTYLGLYLDQVFQVKPICLITGIFMGFLSALLYLFKMVWK